MPAKNGGENVFPPNIMKILLLGWIESDKICYNTKRHHKGGNT